MEVMIQNDLVSTNDHMTATIRKKSHNKNTESDISLKPGQRICLDLIKSSSQESITTETSYKDYFLAVDALSRLSK